MKLITKFMLATTFVGSVALTSCKDYEEDETNSIVAGVSEKLAETADALADMQRQIDALAGKIQPACGCDMVTISKDANGKFTISDKNGTVIYGGAAADGNGVYGIYTTDGTLVRIPEVVADASGNITGIKIGDQTYDLTTGTTGPAGPAGATGATGATGPAGKSAYDIAVENGFVGTPAEWLESLKGEKGDKGEAGAAGSGSGSDATYELVKTVVGDQVTISLKKTENGTTSVVNTYTKTIYNTTVTSDKDESNNPVLVIARYDIDGKIIDQSTIPFVSREEFTQEVKKLADLNAIINGGTKSDGTEVNPGLVKRMEDAESDISEIQKELYGEGGTHDNPKKGSVLERLKSLETSITEMLERLDNIEEALAEQVTGIIVQQVWNPAIGTYNSIMTNGQSNFVFAYYGEAAETLQFPSCDPQEIISAGDPLVSDVAGMLYVTINPLDVDFTGLKSLKLVNSLGEETAVKLGAATPATEALTLGWSLDPTRAAGNGTYILPATIDADKVEQYNLLVDKKQIAAVVKEFVKVRSAESKKIAAKEAAEDLAKLIVDQVNNMRPQALGVECAWDDAYGEHRVVSNYNIGAMAFKPLGFNALDKLEEVENVPGYSQLVSFLGTAKDKIDAKVIARINKELDKYGEKINQRGIILIESVSNEDFNITISYEGNADVEATIKKINQEYIDKGQKPVLISHDPAKKQMVVRLEVDEMNDFIAGIAYNDLATFTDMVNDLLRKMDGKIEKYEDKAYNKVLEYLDKVNTYGTKAIHKMAIVTKPVLLVNSNEGLGIATVKGAVPRKVSGKVVIYPTTYSGETISPAYMKYISINGVGELVTEKEIDITSKLVSGKNTIVYSALDYAGNEISVTYQLEK